MLPNFILPPKEVLANSFKKLISLHVKTHGHKLVDMNCTKDMSEEDCSAGKREQMVNLETQSLADFS